METDKLLPDLRVSVTTIPDQERLSHILLLVVSMDLRKELLPLPREYSQQEAVDSQSGIAVVPHYRLSEEGEEARHIAEMESWIAGLRPNLGQLKSLELYVQSSIGQKPKR